MYVFHTDAHGKIKVIEDYSLNDQDGTFPSFRPDPALPEYQAFLDWFREKVAVPVDLEQQLPPSSVLFFHFSALAIYCRHLGIMLYAPGGHFSPGISTKHGEVTLHGLQRAWPKSTIGEKPDEDSGITGHLSKLVVTEQVLEDLRKEVCDENGPVRRISSLPIWRTFAYLDVSDFSKYKPGQEALIINSLVGVVHEQTLWSGVGADVWRAFEAMLCIGDGYIFVFKDPIQGTQFAAYLAQIIEVLVANKELPVNFHFRMGVHFGSVYSFWDPGRDNWNYIGDGINGGNRVLAAVGKEQDDVVFISGQIREEILKVRPRPRLLDCLINRGRKKDKHDNPWRVYELNHTALCGSDVPERYRNSV